MAAKLSRESFQELMRRYQKEPAELLATAYNVTVNNIHYWAPKWREDPNYYPVQGGARPHRHAVTVEESEQIAALRLKGLSHKEIQKRVNRSHTVVSRELQAHHLTDPRRGNPNFQKRRQHDNGEKQQAGRPGGKE